MSDTSRENAIYFKLAGSSLATNTPETDAKIASGFTSEEMQEQHVPASFARKLERERNEARAKAAELSGRLECQMQATATGCYGFSHGLPDGDHLTK